MRGSKSKAAKRVEGLDVSFEPTYQWKWLDKKRLSTLTNQNANHEQIRSLKSAQPRPIRPRKMARLGMSFAGENRKATQAKFCTATLHARPPVRTPSASSRAPFNFVPQFQGTDALIPFTPFCEIDRTEFQGIVL